MTGKSDLTAEALRQLLQYDPETGVFKWILRRGVSRYDKCWNTRYAGSQAGSDDGRGYVTIRIYGHKYRAHRLAWLFSNGNWPADEIDHINGAKSDNRLCNLREASHLENCQNYKVGSNNSSGHPGFYFHSGKRKFHARIRVRREWKNLGYFRTKDEAVAARDVAKAKFHPFNPTQRFST